LKDLGCTTAYNLDGGGSSAMYFNGELVNNPLGRGKERGVSDILYIGA
jgi:exopolysaccharide biosynthesis protein